MSSLAAPPNPAVAAHNPLSIWTGVPPWEGEIDEPYEPTKFKDNVFGFRAGARYFMGEFDKYNANTIPALFLRWHTKKYKEAPVAYQTGISITTGWDLTTQVYPKTYNDLYRLLYAITVQEQGQFPPFKAWELTDALRRAGISDVPPTPWHKRWTAIAGLVGMLAAGGPLVANFMSLYEPRVKEFGQGHPWIIYTFYGISFLAGAVALGGNLLRLTREKT